VETSLKGPVRSPIRSRSLLSTSIVLRSSGLTDDGLCRENCRRRSSSATRPAISGSAEIFLARRSRTTGAVIRSPVWKRMSLRSVTVSCRPSSDSTSDSASLNTGRPSHAAATSGSELNTPARSTSGERPDFGRNVPI
jgi:hypothetical protein